MKLNEWCWFCSSVYVFRGRARVFADIQARPSAVGIHSPARLRLIRLTAHLMFRTVGHLAT